MKNSGSALRIIEHQKVKNLMETGQLIQALSVAQLAVSNFGCHVGLLCDLAACQYEMGFFFECEQTAQKIQTEHGKCVSFLSEASNRKTSLFLSKLLEESGKISSSLFLIHQILDSVSTDTHEKQMIEIQKLRILSSLHCSDQLSKIYLKVSTQQTQSKFNQIELLHSLMCAESTLFGFSHATHRWQQLIQEDLCVQDLRLVCRDFLEIALLKNEVSNDSVTVAIEKLKNNQPMTFDCFLIDLIENSKIKSDYLFSSDLSFVQKLRILVLEYKFETDTAKKIELRKKFIFALQSLSEKDASYFKNWIPESDQATEFVLNFKTNSVTFDGDRVQLTHMQMKIFELFNATNCVTLEFVSKYLWDETYLDFHYDRIRMMIYKMNKIFNKKNGQKILEITKNHLQLSSKIKFK